MSPEHQAFSAIVARHCTCGEIVRDVKTLDGARVVVLHSPRATGNLDIVAWNRRCVWVDLHATPDEPDYDPQALRLEEHKHNG